MRMDCTEKFIRRFLEFIPGNAKVEGFVCHAFE